MERQLDAFVSDAGGERVEILDLWRAIGNLCRRLIRHPPGSTDDLYVLPTDVLRGAS